MDSNKDEANRCIEIGLTALRLGNPEKAAKMFEKAQRLFPCTRAEQLLKEVHSRQEKPHSNSGQDPSNSDDSGQTRRRRPQESTSEGPSNEAKPYTEDQLTVVKKVLKCKDFYEVLAVAKDSTDAQIKKAYKKLALQLHPDKNSAPGAVEAFKKVGNAVSILTDGGEEEEVRLVWTRGGGDSQQQTIKRRIFGVLRLRLVLLGGGCVQHVLFRVPEPAHAQFQTIQASIRC